MTTRRANCFTEVEMISILLFGIFAGVVSAVEPTVVCPAPRSPENGQAFLYQEGQTVKYVCEPGHFLHGKDINRCVDGQWEDLAPLCLKMSFEDDSVALPEDARPPIARTRPLFAWGPELDEEAETPDEEAETPDEEAETPDEEAEHNSTSVEDLAMGDEARRVLLYPRRRVFTRRIRPARIQRGTELEDEQKRRSSGGGEDSSTTIHLQAPPSYIYVRRAAGTSDVRRIAPLHMTVDAGDGTSRVQVLSGHRAAVEAQNDKGQQTDEAYRRMYWWNHHYYPRQASLAQYYYRQDGSPVATTLSESQVAWINSLHPEVRDQYLKDIYSTSYNGLDASALAYYSGYGDPYYYYHQSLPYYREPATVVVENPISSYDYSCHQAHSSFYKAPKLPNAHIARYDRRQNPDAPQNHYLTAVYRCDPGYVVLDTRHTELYCSQRRWVGPQPVCVPARG